MKCSHCGKEIQRAMDWQGRTITITDQQVTCDDLGNHVTVESESPDLER